MQMWLLLILSQYYGGTASYISENIQRMSVIQSVQHLELSNVLNFYWFSTHLHLHLSDAFIQSDLQLHSGYTFSLVCVFPGNGTHNLLRC